MCIHLQLISNICTWIEQMITSACICVCVLCMCVWCFLIVVYIYMLQKKQVSKEADYEKIIVLRNFGFGFGNLIATVENTPPGSDEVKLPDPGELFVQAASNCCGKMCDRCCCMCCIQMCSRLNDQCAIVFIQFCGALSCLGCYYCCELCCGSGR